MIKCYIKPLIIYTNKVNTLMNNKLTNWVKNVRKNELFYKLMPTYSYGYYTLFYWLIQINTTM